MVYDDTILIVEDDPNMRITLCDIFEAKGYTTFSVSSAKEAIEEVKVKLFSVALIDLRLDDASGLDVLKEVKEFSPRTECIMVTGFASQESAIDAINLGAYSYVVKPYRMDDLLLTVRRAIEKSTTEDALQESEKRFRTLYENAPLPFQSLNTDGYIVDVNKTWLNALGYTKAEVIGKSFTDFLPTEMKEYFLYNYSRFKEKGEMLGVELELMKKDGSRLLALFNANIGLYESGKSKQTHWIFHDVTEARRLEKEREYLQQQLNQSQKMEAVGTLAGGIAHDFNNILSSIIGHAEFVRNEFSKESQASRDLAEVIASANRATHLVKQILTFSRKADIRKELLRSDLVIKESLQMLRSTLPTTIEIEENIDSDCGRILADHTNIYQIMMNLCTNAKHAMESGKGVLSISLKRQELCEDDNQDEDQITSGPFAVLTISDTGCGISNDDLPRIFEPYFTTKKVGSGTGLGLAVTHGIVKNCEGFIRVESVVGKGSSFHIFLPIKNGTDAEPVILKSVSENTIAPAHTHILLVDDEPLLLKINQRRLEYCGYKVSSFKNSTEALTEFQKDINQFDILITDQTMPGLTGEELTMAVLTLRPDFRVIMCTGHSDILSKEQALALGIKKYVLKPLQADEILIAIGEVLNGK